MSSDSGEEGEYINCKKCKLRYEKIINERTNKPYTLCEICHSKCRSKTNKKMNIMKI